MTQSLCWVNVRLDLSSRPGGVDMRKQGQVSGRGETVCLGVFGLFANFADAMPKKSAHVYCMTDAWPYETKWPNENSEDEGMFISNSMGGLRIVYPSLSSAGHVQQLIGRE